jgi:hypothetical protein
LKRPRITEEPNRGEAHPKDRERVDQWRQAVQALPDYARERLSAPGSGPMLMRRTSVEQEA